MKISEGIMSLHAILEKEGDLELRVEADHGQVKMEADAVVACYIDISDGEYMPDNVDDSEVGFDSEDPNYRKVAVVFA